MSSKLLNAPTYIFMVFIVAVFFFLITDFGDSLMENPNAELSNDSKDYINKISGNDQRVGLNTSTFDKNIKGVTEVNATDNKNDFSLDFNFGLSSANKFVQFAGIALNLPEAILINLFNLPAEPVKPYADLLDWLYRISLFVAIYLFARGRVRQ